MTTSVTASPFRLPSKPILSSRSRTRSKRNWFGGSTKKLFLSYLLTALIGLQLGFFGSLHQSEILGLTSSTSHLSNTDTSCVTPIGSSGQKQQPQRRRQDLLQSFQSEPSSPPPLTEIATFVPPALSKLVTGAAVLQPPQTKDFLDTFPLGSPIREPEVIIDRTGVLILYHTPSSLPDRVRNATSMPVLDSVQEAFENCRQVKQIIATVADPSSGRNAQTCLAIVGATESFHIQRWNRVDPDAKKSWNSDTTRETANTTTEWEELFRDWEHTSRYKARSQASLLMNSPSKRFMDISMDILQTYLLHFDKALEELKPMAAQVAGAGTSDLVKGTVIVMVCNFGHADILLNFFCSARAAGIDLNKILLFATDQETYDLTRAFGVMAYHHPEIFASIPKEASSMYGDATYGRIMMSKVYCVHMVSHLGYDIFFQDVDIIPYQSNYLEYFVEKAKSGEHDLYFQNDYNPRMEYAPWVSNSGCYYAVNNARTKHFFLRMAYLGAVVLTVRSHQSTMHSLLSELESQYGLRIKNLIDENEKIPIGWHFHTNPSFMKQMILRGKNGTLSFHMNWNAHKKHKREFLEQMGDWYLQDKCTGDQTVASIAAKSGEGGAATEVDYISTCCSAEPLIRCHYKDKPSLIPCNGSPPFEAKNSEKSFW